MKNVIR